MKYSNIFL